jgi:histidine phosphotransferase ChpT
MRLELLGLGRVHVARLCHDLGGVAGTLAGTLDLADGSDPSLRSLLRDTAETLRLRLRLFAAAWGGAVSDMTAQQLAELLQGAPAVPRAGFDVGSLSPGTPLPARLVPLALNVALLGTEALPRGGTVRLAGDAAQGLTVMPEGRTAAWPRALLRGLSGTDPALVIEEEGPRAMLAPLVLLCAAEIGWSVSLAFASDTASAAPLLLTPG